VPAAAIAGQHKASTSVTVAGGKDTDSLGKSQISNDAFQQAIVQSIEKNKTFSSVVKGAGGDYQLSITVVNMEQPSFGFKWFTVRESDIRESTECVRPDVPDIERPLRRNQTADRRQGVVVVRLGTDEIATHHPGVRETQPGHDGIVVVDSRFPCEQRKRPLGVATRRQRPAVSPQVNREPYELPGLIEPIPSHRSHFHFSRVARVRAKALERVV